MSAVHEEIAKAAFDVLPPEEQSILAEHLPVLLKASTYPDVFADKGMTAEQRAQIDPQADLVNWPDPPKTADYEKILEITEHRVPIGAIPLRWAYLTEHYAERSLEALARGDGQLLAKYLGVYSHVIGDTAEPIHAIHPEVVDEVLDPPTEFIGLELHANVEGLKAAPSITGYKPGCMGTTPQQIAMQANADLEEVRRIGAFRVIPIVQALYAKRRQEAMELSRQAQNAIARKFADFMHSILLLAKPGRHSPAQPLDLRTHPYAHTVMESLYRNRPMIDKSLIPYSGGKFHPLSLRRNGQIQPVRGLGVAPRMGPPFLPDTVRDVFIEYYLVPGAYHRFKGWVGINPLFDQSALKAVFSIHADGRHVFQSRPMGVADDAEPFSVSVENCHWLKLSMQYADPPTAQYVRSVPSLGWVLHGAWAEPTLEYFPDK